MLACTSDVVSCAVKRRGSLIYCSGDAKVLKRPHQMMHQILAAMFFSKRQPLSVDVRLSEIACAYMTCAMPVRWDESGLLD
jgi:hypothetical protein